MISQLIDHTLLKPDATAEQIDQLCAEAKEHQFKTVCVETKWLERAVKLLQGTAVLPITVIDFPRGDGTTQMKVEQTQSAIAKGAKEIDMVLSRELIFSRRYQACLEDIRAVVKAAKVPVKVILEISELTDSEIVAACVIAKLAGAAFVKTSTGFSQSGATPHAVKLMRSVVGREMGVKASGGIRDRATFDAMVKAGADRVGASASVAIATASASHPSQSVEY